MKEKELLELKEEIDEAKQKVSELTGQKKVLMNQLKTEWACSTIEQAEAKLDNIGKRIAKLEQEIDEGVEEIEKLLNPEEEEDGTT